MFVVYARMSGVPLTPPTTEALCGKVIYMNVVFTFLCALSHSVTCLRTVYVLNHECIFTFLSA